MLSLESSIPGGVRGDIRLVAEEESDVAEDRDDDDDDDAAVDNREKKGIETTDVEDDDDDDDVDDVEDVDDCGWAAGAADCRAMGTKEEANAPAKVAAEEARDEEEKGEVDDEDDEYKDDAEYDDRSFGAVELLRPADDEVDAAGREAAALAVLSYELKLDVVAVTVSTSSTSIRGRLAAFDRQSPSGACCWAPVAFTVGGSSTIPCLSPHKHHAQR
jgi:hypothetical protein